MTTALQTIPAVSLPVLPGSTVPALVADAGERASIRFIEFFTANIRNPNTLAAYARSVTHRYELRERHGLGGLPT